MSIYTPRGLKIRVPVRDAFALMARLHPHVSAFRILKTTEGIETIPGLLSFAGGVAGYAFGLAPLQLGAVVAGGHVIGMIMNAIGLFLPGLVPLATIMSYVTGYGFFLLAGVTMGYVVSGWTGALAYLAGRLAAVLLGYVIEWVQAYRLHAVARALGYSGGLTASEQNFVNAYRLHALKCGKSTDITLTEEELDEESWLPCFADLKYEWPNVVARFSPYE
ncbi:MAG: hypothetical protein GX649_03480 [Chloroflexi bacterium]|nr:hypothetical protein [Chloroflexota bacterium]